MKVTIYSPENQANLVSAVNVEQQRLLDIAAEIDNELAIIECKRALYDALFEHSLSPQYLKAVADNR